jgi:hypothetical protein
MLARFGISLAEAASSYHVNFVLPLSSLFFHIPIDRSDSAFVPSASSFSSLITCLLADLFIWCVGLLTCFLDFISPFFFSFIAPLRASSLNFFTMFVRTCFYFLFFLYLAGGSGGPLFSSRLPPALFFLPIAPSSSPPFVTQCDLRACAFIIYYLLFSFEWGGADLFSSHPFFDRSAFFSTLLPSFRPCTCAFIYSSHLFVGVV